MNKFTIQLTRAAQKDLNRLGFEDPDHISQDLQTLKENPFGRPPRIKRLKGFSFPLYRLRSGGFRVLYRVDELVITVMRIIDRKDLESTLRRLQEKKT